MEKVIKCIAKASPKPNANWYRDGKKLDITNCTSPADKRCKNVIYEVYEEDPKSALYTTFTKQVLKIRSALYPRDQGKFDCIATNGVQPPAKLAFDLDVHGMYIAPRCKYTRHMLFFHRRHDGLMASACQSIQVFWSGFNPRPESLCCALSLSALVGNSNVVKSDYRYLTKSKLDAINSVKLI